MFVEMYQAQTSSEEGGEDLVKEYRRARAEGFDALVTFSGIGHAKLAAAIGSSATYIAKITSEPLALGKYIGNLTDAFCLPDAISDPDATTDFYLRNRIFCRTVDALLKYRPTAGQSTEEMPTQYILRRVKAYFSKSPEEGEKLSNYFKDPSDVLEDEIKPHVRTLEKILRLPPQSISSPKRVAARNDYTVQLKLAISEVFAENLRWAMKQRDWSAPDVAREAGVSEHSVEAALAPDANSCSLKLVVAVAGALGVEVADMLTPMGLANKAEAVLTEENTFSKLPGEARKLIVQYRAILLQAEDDGSIPKGKMAVLLLTPFIRRALDVLVESANKSKMEEPANISELVAPFLELFSKKELPAN